MITKYFSLEANWTDYPDSSEMCVSVGLPGCDHNCDGCHSPNFQNRDYKSSNLLEYNSVEELYSKIAKYAKRNRTNNIAIMGGDPLFIGNILTTKALCIKLINNDFNVIVYTGYSNIDYVKTIGLYFTYIKLGKYEKDNKTDGTVGLTDDTLTLASKNQKICDREYRTLSYNGVFKYK